MERKIYLSGGMTGLDRDAYVKWRTRFKKAVTITYDKHPSFFDPTLFYQPDANLHISEREVMDYELDQLRKSDLVVVNFNSPQSIGTAMELAIARERKIPVIGLNETGNPLHPWLSECCIRVCASFRELVEYVVEYYLYD